MPLVLNEEQRLLKESARDFVSQNLPVTDLRRLRDTEDETGFDRDKWKAMADLGWAGIIIPEEFGGVDFGYVGLGIVLEETGRCLAASPLVSTVLLSTTAILLAGSKAQKEAKLPSIAAGERLFAFALEEGPHHAPFDVSTTAESKNDGYVLNGKKTFVFDGHIADELIVVARTSGNSGDKSGLSLFLVDRQADGVNCTRTIMVDSRNAANVQLKNVKLSDDALLGQLGEAGDIVEQILDRGRIGLAAEMLGNALAAFEITHDYLQTRTQFGQLIGSFQALQHRAAQMFCELEISKSCVLQALQAIDQQANNIPLLASLAKAQLSDTLHLVSSEGIQMHGGVGMTDEYDIGFLSQTGPCCGTSSRQCSISSG